jgi:hypothetical protein
VLVHVAVNAASNADRVGQYNNPEVHMLDAALLTAVVLLCVGDDVTGPVIQC